MKVKEYEQMMRYLTSTGEFKRNKNTKGNYIVENAKKFDIKNIIPLTHFN